MITVRDLRKTYGEFVAVDGATFDVAEGEVFGVVGPNGAGKTTTLKMIAGLIEPSAGSATVAGYDAEDPRMRQYLGFLPEESPLYEEMTAVSYLRFFADLYDVPRDVADRRIDETLDQLDLDHRDRPLGDVSKGMKRKVAIARSLVNDPDVLVYDEPASGLDPLTTNYVVDFTRDLADSGRTVVFSAHNLYHVESVCDRIAIMADGHIVARGSIGELRDRYGDTEYRVMTDIALDDSVETADGHVTSVADVEGVDAVREAAEAAGGRVIDIRSVEPSLEQLFLDIAQGGATAAPGPSRDARTHGRRGGRTDDESRTDARRADGEADSTAETAGAPASDLADEEASR